MESKVPQTNGDLARVAGELAGVKAVARAAYLSRDADAFMTVFHPALVYTQANGRTITHEQLTHDVRDQLMRGDSISAEFRSEGLELLDSETATETIEQQGSFVVRAFGFLRREWTVSRRSRYEWVRTATTWRVRRVEVLREEMVSRFSVGLP